jgi:hypothetical protein
MKTRTLQWMAFAGLLLSAACNGTTGPLEECVLNPDENQLVCTGPAAEQPQVEGAVRIAQ